MRRSQVVTYSIATILLLFFIFYLYKIELVSDINGNDVKYYGLLPACPKHLVASGERLQILRNTVIVTSARAKFLANFRKSHPGASPSSLILVHSGSKSLRDPINGDMHFPFEPQAHFRYLTSIIEPDCILAVNPLTGGFTLFRPEPRSESQIIFYGELEAAEEMKRIHQLENVLPLSELKTTISNASEIFTLDDRWLIHQWYVAEGEEMRKVSSSTSSNLLELVFQTCFAIKSPLEISLIQHSLDVTFFALNTTLSLFLSQPHAFSEYDLAQMFLYQSGICGCQTMSYYPIIGANKNILVLDYDSRSRDRMASSDLSSNHQMNSWLFDVGAQCFGYAADVTRTILVSGETEYFTMVKGMILDIMRILISYIKPGITMGDVEFRYNEILAEKCFELGILKKLPPSTRSVASVFTVHSIVHSVGLVVHEKTPSPTILADMVVAVEPAFYLYPQLIEEGGLKEFLNTDLIHEMIRAGFKGYRFENIVHIVANGPNVIF